jgi:hypothetical protein
MSVRIITATCNTYDRKFIKIASSTVFYKILEFCLVSSPHSRMSLKQSYVNILSSIQNISQNYTIVFKNNMRMSYENRSYIFYIKSNDYKNAHDISDIFSNFQRTIYFHKSHFFDTLEYNNDIMFNLYDLSNYIGYTKRSYLSNYYGLRRGYIKMMRIDGNIYTNYDGIMTIFQRGRTPILKELVECFKNESTTLKISHPIEVNVLSEIIDFIGDEQYELQYKIGSYKIDMYVPKFKLAIEVDEVGHTDRNVEYERTREEYIKNNLTTNIFRINPNDQHYRSSKMLGILRSKMIH